MDIKIDLSLDDDVWTAALTIPALNVTAESHGKDAGTALSLLALELYRYEFGQAEFGSHASSLLEDVTQRLEDLLDPTEGQDNELRIMRKALSRVHASNLGFTQQEKLDLMDHLKVSRKALHDG